MPPLPTLEWDDTVARMRWAQGEHVSIVGPTGGGKTTLALALLPQRDYVAILATKPRDPLLRGKGYRRIKRWPPPPADSRVVLWPQARRRGVAVAAVREAVCSQQAHALDDIYHAGGWTVYLDEAQFTAGFCGLADELRLLWLHGRSLGVSLVVAAQRPVHLPAEAWSQATHLFAAGIRDARDVGRLAEISGLDRKVIAAAIQHLARYEMLYVHRDGQAWITQAPAP